MAGKSGPPKGGKRGKRPGAPLKEGDDGFGRERLQKVLAAAGVASRRDCEELIREGRVEVDGEVVTEMGVKVDPAQSEIRVDGTPLRKAKLVYYALNKPQGVVCTNYDPSGRPRVIDLLPSDERVFPVGRLDRASEGLILVTNDGAFANRVTHPRFGVDKTYIVRVAGKPDPKSLLQLRKGIWTSEGVCRVQSVHIKGSRGNSTDLIIVLNEGKNREIRRILARVGHKVLLLRRVAVGPVRLGKIEPGTFRRVTSAEIEALLEESRQKRRRGDKADGSRPPRGEAASGGKPRGAAAGGKGGKTRSAELDEDDYDDELVAPERPVREEMLSPSAGLTGVQGDVIDFDDDDAPLPPSRMNVADLPLLDGDDDEDDDLQADEGISAELLDDDFDSEEPGGWPDEDEDEEDDDFGGGAFREAGAAPSRAARPPRGGRQSGGPPRSPRGGAGKAAGGGRPAGRGKPAAKPGGKGRGGYQGERTGGEGQFAETQSAGLGRAKFGKGKRPGGGKPLGGKPGGGKRGAGKPRTGGGTSSHAGGGGQSDYGRRGAGRGKGGGKPSGGKFGGGGKGGRGKGRSGGGRG